MHERFHSPEIVSVPELSGHHVTDDPQPILDALRTGTPLDRGLDVTAHDDLLASGLYFSDAPQLWMGRSAVKWRFVNSLDEQQRGAIAERILRDSRFTGEWYLTDSEKARAATWLEEFIQTGRQVYLEFLAEQPYNVASWKPEFLGQIGVENTSLPQVVPVEVQGVFADVASARLSAQLITTLKYGGFDGVFVRGSVAFLPQAVVWHNSAVRRFGEYVSGG